MSEGSKTSVRLSKAAREFNVGLSTIVEYLSKKGHQVDPSPNTKLSPAMYDLLIKEYQSEKQVKEVSKKLGIEYSDRKTITADEVINDQFDEDEDDFDAEELIIKNVSGGFKETIQTKFREEKKPEAPKAKETPVVAKKEEASVAKEKVKEEIPPVESEIPKSEKPEETSKDTVKTELKAEVTSETKVEAKPKAEVKSETKAPIDVAETVKAETVKAEKTKEAPKENKTKEAAEKPAEEKSTQKESVKEEILAEKPAKETEKPVEKEVAAEEKTTTVEAPLQPKDGELKILGKIDLSAMNMRTKPDRKTKAQKKKEADEKRLKEKGTRAEKKSTTEASAEKVAKKPVVQTEEKTQEATPKAETSAEQERPVNFMPTEVRKLEGPKILDKIELPQTRRPKPKPVASSSEDKLSASQKKKKRKRIKTKPTEGMGGPGRPDISPTLKTKDQVKKGGSKPTRRDEKKELTDEDIQRQIKETLARLSPAGKSKASKHRRQKRDHVSTSHAEEMAQQEIDKSILKVTEFVTANELATMMNIPVTQVIATCMSLGMFVSINQRLDAETLTLVAEEFGFELEFISADVQEALAEFEEEDRPEDMRERAPIVTVMGHVDHGKTLLLDFIRKANVTSGEAGGITQHIGAYEVSTESGRKVTFLDTPGHEAFTAMRARGAKITDVAIIVIAADDSVMPQTIEAVNHAQAAGVPIVFAFNKMDKPTANADRIREQLANMNVLVEEWGGKFQTQEISAKTGQGIESLLEKVLLESEILDLKGNPVKNSKGTVIESSLDKGRGYVAKVLVQDGTLKVGDIILAGSTFGRVKAMFNERNQAIKEAGPSTPLLLLGLNGAPQAGDIFNVMQDEREAKNIAQKRQQLQREQGLRTQKHITLDEIGRRIAIGDFKELNLIVKGDVDGSVEALSDSMLNLSTEEVQVNVIHKSVGAISESDIMLASASNAIVIGFQVRPTLQARKLAENEEIDIRLYSIIYTAIEEIKAAIEGMLAPEIEEVITSNIEIREVFKITKVGTIAGCMVLDGKITRNSKIRIIRDGIVIYTGTLGSLKRFKDDVKEVSAGYECGLNIDNFNDIKVGDIIEGYTEKEVSRKL
ncbi:MAG: translation initiation factor IF-2 [Bacteroidales bacterium]|jgi:translation initiation factor IF-2|nr:translation initiation factor IF-2 [Bacteroidales bacterium]